MANTSIRVKVNIADLIDMAEKRKARLERAHAAEQAKFVKEFEGWRKKITKYVEDVTPENIDTLGWPHHPYSPRPAGELSRVTADIALLRRSTDETIIITSSSNLYRYFEEN